MLVSGYATYKGFMAQQHIDAFNVFKSFLLEIKPKRILEIGTAGGGFILFLRNVLDTYGLNETKIQTYDIIEKKWYDKLRDENIDIIIDNIFDSSYKALIKPEQILPFIQEEGTTLVLCDGGNKITEFNVISPHIKKGDFIMAHDYCESWEIFESKYKYKIWNWCEIQDFQINDVSQKENLVSYNKMIFDDVVWVCKQKI